MRRVFYKIINSLQGRDREESYFLFIDEKTGEIDFHHLYASYDIEPKYLDIPESFSLLDCFYGWNKNICIRGKTFYVGDVIYHISTVDEEESYAGTRIFWEEYS